MTRFFPTAWIIFSILALAACGDNRQAETPLETLKAYNQAIKSKDTTTIKSLLSKGSLKMAADEAKSLNVTVDEILQRETLFLSGEKSLEYRNEKVEGESANIEVKNSAGSFEKIYFTREGSSWKIAKEKYAEEMMKQADEEMKQLDEQINQGKMPDESTNQSNQRE